MGGELYAEEHGAGDPVLLIQGLGYAVWAWRGQLRALAASRHAIAFDNRGAGRSVKSEGPYSIEGLADDAAAVIRTLADGRAAHVGGFSMGGYVAQMLALREPDVVRSLTLISTAAGGPQTLPLPEATRDAWLAAADLPPAEYARRTMWLSFAPGWTDEHPEEYDRLLAARLEFPTPPESWAAQFEACNAFLQRATPLKGIRVPALVLHGDADRVVPVENGRALAAGLPDARLVELPARGHLALLEAPDEVNGALIRFLDEVEAA